MREHATTEMHLLPAVELAKLVGATYDPTLPLGGNKQWTHDPDLPLGGPRVQVDNPASLAASVVVEDAYGDAFVVAGYGFCHSNNVYSNTEYLWLHDAAHDLEVWVPITSSRRTWVFEGVPAEWALSYMEGQQ